MPRRDEQEYEERRQQIINGALVVFSQKGFEEATNRDIAKAAGIGSPGLIYHYFKDKADLLRQVLENRSPGLQLMAGRDLLLDRPLHEVLDLFGRTFLAALSDHEGIALFRVMLGEALRRPMLAEMLNDLGPMPAFALITQYLSAQMAAGSLRRTDPGAATRCFIGPLLGYALTRVIFPLPDAQTLAPETMVAVTVETFLRGMDYRYPGTEQGRENA
jgi:TetR/AcrR family transcriptional regulator, mexJK operon transcriptional repressor